MLNGSNYKTLAPAPPRRDQMYFDNAVKSLALRVYASGKGTWVVQYRPKNIAGDRSKIGTRKAVIGDRGNLSLSQARVAARSILAKIDQGEDPVTKKHLLREQARNTIQQLILDYSTDLERRAVVNRKTAISALKRGFKGQMSKDVTELKLSDILKIIETIEKKGLAGSAQDFRKHASAFMSFCNARGIISGNPLAGYRRPRKTRAEIVGTEQYGRVLNDAELKAIWIAAQQRHDSFGNIVQFLILSGTRRKEAASLRREFIESQWIKYPATFTKQARGHSIPRSEGINRLLDATPYRGDLVWPSTKIEGGNTPISGWTKYLLAIRQSSRVYDFTLHDFRRTFRTWAEESYGASDSLCEAAIGHVSKNILNRIYSRPKWEDDLTNLFESWSKHISKITASGGL